MSVPSAALEMWSTASGSMDPALADSPAGGPKPPVPAVRWSVHERAAVTHANLSAPKFASALFAGIGQNVMRSENGVKGSVRPYRYTFLHFNA
jgi:hypothetical protein